MKNRFGIFLFKIIPKGFISRLFGIMMNVKLPGFILTSVIDWFCAGYGVKKEEILYPDHGFKTFNAFFTRNLKDGTHKVGNENGTIVSPVDAKISSYGNIEKDSLLQAKGIQYQLGDLIPSEISDIFQHGSYITLYLSPGDYHHIHTPVDGDIIGFYAIPGKLFPVKEFMVNGLDNLFSKNERMICYLKNDKGLAAVCMIGAMNVGRISLSFSDLETNKTFRRQKEFFYPSESQPNVKKGERIGTFNLGSTVILLFQKDMIRFESLEVDSKVRLGEKIARYI